MAIQWSVINKTLQQMKPDDIYYIKIYFGLFYLK